MYQVAPTQNWLDSLWHSAGNIPLRVWHGGITKLLQMCQLDIRDVRSQSCSTELRVGNYGSHLNIAQYTPENKKSSHICCIVSWLSSRCVVMWRQRQSAREAKLKHNKKPAVYLGLWQKTKQNKGKDQMITWEQLELDMKLWLKHEQEHAKTKKTRAWKTDT